MGALPNASQWVVGGVLLMKGNDGVMIVRARLDCAIPASALVTLWKQSLVELA
jgi:hypothetical protein